MIARAEVDALTKKLFEAAEMHGDVVVAGQQERRGVAAGGVRHGLHFGACLGFGYGDFRAGDNRATGVGHEAADGGAKFLGKHGRG